MLPVVSSSTSPLPTRGGDIDPDLAIGFTTRLRARKALRLEASMKAFTQGWNPRR